MTKKYKIYSQHVKILADLHTPVSAYNKLRDIFPGSLLFESADYHDRTDNKSIICIDPIAGFTSKYLEYSIDLPGNKTITATAEYPSQVMAKFKELLTSFKNSDPELSMPISGFWGYSSFESVQYMEDIHFNHETESLKKNPDFKYQLFKYFLIFDHFTKELTIAEICIDTLPKDMSGINRILKIIQSNQYTHFKFRIEDKESSPIPDSKFKKMVSNAIAHCKRGDCFQVVLSREFRQKFKGDDFSLYRCLRSVSPSPYLFYLDYGDYKIFGSSPESQIQIQESKAYINPIAGTVRRGKDTEEDRIKAEELKNNSKEIAEHIMLVDLARNDLSKNSDKVEVENYAEVQYFSQVIHMVSKVRGNISKDKMGIDIYADTFPAGTLSGAPKYRAMQIINDNESAPRNFYGGSVGYFGFNGTVNHAIIIRSILSKNNTLIYQAGAGVVSESTEEGELNEVDNKLRAIRKAIIKANNL